MVGGRVSGIPLFMVAEIIPVEVGAHSCMHGSMLNPITTSTQCLFSADSPKKDGSKHSPSKGKHSKKRERGEGNSSPADKVGDNPNGRLATPGGSAEPNSPPAKKQKAESSTNTITEEEVKRYLMRRPIASKDLVRKFINKKTDMDRNRIVEVLHKVIEGLKNVEKQTVKGKLYLSLKNPTTMD
jgi:hypothetical protein